MEVVTVCSASDEASIFDTRKNTGGLDRGRSGTLTRDCYNIPVTERDVCNDSADIRNRVSSQTVMMITGILEGSSNWRSDKTSLNDWETNTASAD